MPNRGLTMINEPGLYKVILRSDKPDAKKFMKWVTHDVLPSIRKHGAYITSEKMEELMSDPETWVKLIRALQDERKEKAILQDQIENAKPKIIFADAVSVSESDILIGELAIKYGVVCWKPGTAYNASVACFNSWLDDKEGVGDDENRQILEHVKAFFELHAHSRFFDLDGFKDQKIVNMAGYKTISKNTVTFFVSPSVFQNEICKNFRRKAVISLLIEKGFLLKDHNGDYRQQKWTPYGNKKVYVISGKILLG